jgi:hypothetical protein
MSKTKNLILKIIKMKKPMLECIILFCLEIEFVTLAEVINQILDKIVKAQSNVDMVLPNQ